MSSPNPFAPPLAQVHDIEPAQQFQQPRIFAVSGRIGRLRLLAYTMGASLLVAFFGGRADARRDDAAEECHQQRCTHRVGQKTQIGRAHV